MANQLYTDHVNALVNYVEYIRPSISDALPTTSQVREIMSGIVNKKTGRSLRSTPNRHKNPLANAVHRLVTWHCSQGNLTGIKTVEWDCIIIAKSLDIQAGELFDQLMTLSVIITQGQSQAIDKWKHALTDRS